VAADAAAALPTIRKAWHDPDSEDVLFYVLVGTGATITLLTIRSWGPSGWAFAGYMLALRRLHDLGGRRPSAIMSRLKAARVPAAATTIPPTKDAQPPKSNTRRTEAC
jgi:hypothetical protein